MARRAELSVVLEQEQSRIQPLMQEAGITSEPEVTFWRKLETGDEVGWDA